jgi:hypothetical protein
MKRKREGKKEGRRKREKERKKRERKKEIEKERKKEKEDKHNMRIKVVGKAGEVCHEGNWVPFVWRVGK